MRIIQVFLLSIVSMLLSSYCKAQEETIRHPSYSRQASVDTVYLYGLSTIATIGFPTAYIKGDECGEDFYIVWYRFPSMKGTIVVYRGMVDYSFPIETAFHRSEQNRTSQGGKTSDGHNWRKDLIGRISAGYLDVEDENRHLFDSILDSLAVHNRKEE